MGGGSGEASEQHKRTNGNRRTWGVPGRPRSSTSARTATVVRGGFRGGLGAAQAHERQPSYVGGSGEAAEQHKRTNGNRRTWGVPGRPRSSTSARTATA